MCENTVTQFVARGDMYREVEVRCGSMGSEGSTLLCDDCRDMFRARYPQGWVHSPGDVCKHGNYVGGNGADYMCGECENW